MTPLYDNGHNRLGNSSIALLIVLALGMVVAVFVGLTIGQGDLKKVYIIGLTLAAFPVLLILGERYWVLIPTALSMSLPAIPIVTGRSLSIAELWVIASVGAFLLRAPFGLGALRFFRFEYLPVCMYVGWAVFIWKINGAGLAILGSSTVGGRSYVTIGLAFAAFLILANQRMEERHAKWIIFSLMIGGVVSTVWSVYAHFFLREASVELEGFYSWHQSLTPVPFFFLAFVFSRFSPQGLLLRFQVGWLGMVALSYGVLAFSGKRAVFAVCLIFPLVAALVRRQYASVIVAGTAVLLMIGFLVVGHSRLFNLPPTVQRVLWIFPGNWDSDVLRDTSGTFRRTLNKLAIAQIKRHPIVGRGFGFTSTDAIRAVEFDPATVSRIVSEDGHLGAYIMAASSVWHSTWLGISATFGIPAAVIWALIWLQILYNAMWVYRRAPPGSYVQILAMMIFLMVIGSLLRSMTSGKADSNLVAGAWQLGILLSTKYALLRSSASGGVEKEAKRPVAGRVHGPDVPRPQMGGQIS